MEWKELTCPECGRQDHLLYAMDSLADRLFEGLFFRVYRDRDDEPLIIQDPDYKDYLDQFNMPKFKKEAAEEIKSGYLGNLHCPACKESLG